MVSILNPSLKTYTSEKHLNIILCGSENFNCNMDKEILTATIKFLERSEYLIAPFLTISKNGIYFSYIF